MKNLQTSLLVASIFVLVGLAAYSNISQELAIDRSKLPSKVEQSGEFQKWITNLKNKDFEIEADDFRLKEENEIYNTKTLTVSSIDDESVKVVFESNIKTHQDTKGIVFSPSGRQYIDYRSINREGYLPNEAHYYGVRDDKLLDSKILNCSVRANCYFDRAYFLSNDVFVISEFSRNIPEEEDLNESTPQVACTRTEVCEYTIKVHVIDLINNSRLVYESTPYQLMLDETIPNL